MSARVARRADSSSEVAAVAFVREQVAWHRENDIIVLGTPIRLLGAHDGEKLATYVFALRLLGGKTDPAMASQQAISGDPLYEAAFRLLASAQLEGQINMRPELHRRVIDTLKSSPKLRQAKRKETNILRDICMTMLVERVRDEFGISPFGRSGKRSSGCKIVADAMKMEYDAVSKVVRKFIEIY